MKVIGICGSPRRGNTEWMLATVMAEAARLGAEVETLLLRKMDVRLCRGCLACEERDEEGKGTCKIKDDMPGVYPRLLAADIIVLATPAYFELLSGRLKNFLDRTCAIWPALEGKRMAGMAVAEEGVGQAVNNLRTYARLCKMRWMGGVSVLAKNPGDASKNKALAGRLKRLAGKMLA